MSRTILIAVGVALAVVSAGAPAGAVPTREAGSLTVRAVLNVRNEKVVSRNTGGHGVGTFTATIAGGKMTWKLTYSRLTSRVLSAHLHLGKFDKIGSVLSGLCTAGERPCFSGMRGEISRAWSPSTLRALKTEQAYVDIHTKRHPGGEIRGQTRRVG
jgi:CHRD domain